jgi:hypothetical protein
MDGEVKLPLTAKKNRTNVRLRTLRMGKVEVNKIERTFGARKGDGVYMGVGEGVTRKTEGILGNSTSLSRLSPKKARPSSPLL